MEGPGQEWASIGESDCSLESEGDDSEEAARGLSGVQLENSCLTNWPEFQIGTEKNLSIYGQSLLTIEILFVVIISMYVARRTYSMVGHDWSDLA